MKNIKDDIFRSVIFRDAYWDPDTAPSIELSQTPDGRWAAILDVSKLPDCELDDYSCLLSIAEMCRQAANELKGLNAE